jgi:MtN3 and saliva related transmembrane protein
MRHSHLPSHKAGAFDFLVYAVSILGPLSTIPQIWKILLTHDASDVSFITWLSGAIIAAIWLIYGLKKKENPLILTNLLWLILNAVVVLQILYYSSQINL